MGLHTAHRQVTGVKVSHVNTHLSQYVDLQLYLRLFILQRNTHITHSHSSSDSSSNTYLFTYLFTAAQLSSVPPVLSETLDNKAATMAAIFMFSRLLVIRVE